MLVILATIRIATWFQKICVNTLYLLAYIKKSYLKSLLEAYGVSTNFATGRLSFVSVD